MKGIDKFFLLRTDGTGCIVEFSRTDQYDKIRNVLGVNGIEVVPMIGSSYAMIVDDEGAINGSHYNAAASYFYRSGSIFGNALIGMLEGPEFVGLGDIDITLFTAYLRHEGFQQTDPVFIT